MGAEAQQGIKDGKVMWWGTITVSKDGKTRTAEDMPTLTRARVLRLSALIYMH
jgi:hypothetical protein